MQRPRVSGLGSAFVLSLGTLCVLSLLTALRPARTAAQEPAVELLPYAQAHHLESRRLGERRRVLVRLPASYETTRRAYPVLVVLDAETQFEHTVGLVHFLARDGRIPEMIVVGIANTERTRDLTPPAEVLAHVFATARGDTIRRTFPAAGGSESFLGFIEDELLPWVDARWRAAPYRVLFGHSFGGLFATYAFARPASAFRAFIAASPSLWWDEGRAVDTVALAAARTDRDLLYLSMGDEGRVMVEPIERLAGRLEAEAAPGLTWRYDRWAGESHNTAPHRSVLAALELLFDGWALPYSTEPDAVNAHYRALEERFGFPAAPSETLVSYIASSLAAAGEDGHALEILQLGAALYPGSAAALGALAEMLTETGRCDEAATAARAALEGARRTEDDLLPHQRRVADIAETCRAAPTFR